CAEARVPGIAGAGSCLAISPLQIMSARMYLNMSGTARYMRAYKWRLWRHTPDTPRRFNPWLPDAISHTTRPAAFCRQWKELPCHFFA
ncbi:MAG: hypothetical protein O9327_01090, partial [Polaromonas sp.]|nr:hypothetical protein [Polaromonas sp.]